jgi:hypothetical protein
VLLTIPRVISRAPRFSAGTPSPSRATFSHRRLHFWSNRAYADYDELEYAAIDAWRRAVLDPDLMKTVCAAKYLNCADLN